MNVLKTEEQIEKEYHVSWYIVAYKLIFGLLEFLLGTGIMLYGHSVLLWYRAFAAQELSEDPHDLLIQLTKGFVFSSLSNHTFLVLYLLLLGSVKIAGAIGLLYKQNWGIDLLVGLTLLILPFQLIQLFLHPSVLDFLYILVGLCIALYLVNFKPHIWAKRVTKKWQMKRPT